MASAFVTAEIEDGSGKTTAIVYEAVATAEAWLTHAARNLTVFSSLATDALKDQSLLRATNFAEEIIRGRVDGTPRTRGQGLTYPRFGSASRAGHRYDSDEIPTDLLVAIRLFAEEDAASALVHRPADGANKIKRERTARGEIEYWQGAETIEERYPLPMAYLRRLWDPSRRTERFVA